MSHRERIKIREEVDLINQGLSALEVFARTGSRLGFQAWMDQIQAFQRQQKKAKCKRCMAMKPDDYDEEIENCMDIDCPLFPQKPLRGANH